MNQKVSDYVVSQLQSLGVTTVFSVAGGASAHLMNSVANSSLEVIQMHHEQACAMAADAYARIAKKPALVLLTNGPGVSNSLTGVLGAFQDSIPMIVISGQVPLRQNMTLSNYKLRQLGVQEVETIGLVETITKYAKKVTSKEEIVKTLANAFEIATTGRPGPVWIEIPLDIQNQILEYEGVTVPTSRELHDIPQYPQYESVLRALDNSKRPLLVVGSGIHLSNSEALCTNIVQSLGIPVVSSWSASDLIAKDDPQYIGNFGILGQRAANFAIQNADLLLILGCRMSIPNIGYETQLFAPSAFKIMVDIDVNELNKESLSIDMKIEQELNEWLMHFPINSARISGNLRWLPELKKLSSRFDIFKEEFERTGTGINSYDFIRELSRAMPRDSIVVTDMGTAFTCTMQALENNGLNRLLTSSGTSSMGFGLPGAIGAQIADKKRTVICVAGDGGFQMNIQELQTLIHNSIPIKIFILNSNGYLAISIMQDNLFGGKYFGSNNASGKDAPSFEKVGNAYGVNSRKISHTDELTADFFQHIFSSNSAELVEIILPDNQRMMPRSQSLKDTSGRIFSSSLEVMWPYLTDTDDINNGLQRIGEV